MIERFLAEQEANDFMRITIQKVRHRDNISLYATWGTAHSQIDRTEVKVFYNNLVSTFFVKRNSINVSPNSM